MHQRTADHSLSQKSQLRGSFDFRESRCGVSVLLVVVAEHGVDIESSGDPFAVYQTVGCESHAGRPNLVTLMMIMPFG